MNNGNNGQLSLLSPSQMVDSSMRKAFKVEDIVKDGRKSETMVLYDRKTLASNFGLTTKKEHREQVDLLVMEQTDKAMSRVVAANTTLPAMGFTLRKIRVQTLSNGDEQLTQVFRKVNRLNKGPSVKAIAAAYGIDESEVAEFVKAAQDRAAEAQIDIESKVDGQNPANQMSDEELERQTAPAVK